LAVLASVGSGRISEGDLCPALHAVAADARSGHGSRVSIELDLPISCRARADQENLSRFLAVLIESRIAQGYSTFRLKAFPGFEGRCRIELRSGPSGSKRAERKSSATLEEAGKLMAKDLGTSYISRIDPVLGTLDVLELPEGVAGRVGGVAAVLPRRVRRASESA